MTRIADASNEDYLLMIAEHGTLIDKALEMAMDKDFADVHPKGTSPAVTPEEPTPIAARRATLHRTPIPHNPAPNAPRITR